MFQNNDSDSEARLAAILETVVDGVICIDSKGIIDLFNLSAAKMFGYRAQEIIGKNVNILMSEPYASEHDRYIARYKRTGKKKIIGIGREAVAKRKNGEIFPVDLAISETEVGGQRIYVGIIRDISQKKKAEQEITKYHKHLEDLVHERTNELTGANKKLEELVHVDGLTGIANRRYFDQTLEYEINRAKRRNTLVSLLMCDIDYFKLYNDNYGHVRGDKCLIKVAACFKEIFMRVTDLPARYGGEEFAVILSGTGLNTAKRMARIFCERLDAMHIVHKHSSVADHVTLSIGIASIQQTNNFNKNDMVKFADKALYKAKEKGRNRIELYGK